MPSGTSYTFKEGMLSPMIKKKICKSGEDCIKEYYSIEVKNQFLHATHPLGWIRRIELEVDNQKVDSKKMYFGLRGQWFAATTLHTIQEVFWYITEPAQICFETDSPLLEGLHYVKCTFVLSMLEDPGILDKKGMWPDRIEFVDGNLTVEESVK